MKKQEIVFEINCHHSFPVIGNQPVAMKKHTETHNERMDMLDSCADQTCSLFSLQVDHFVDVVKKDSCQSRHDSCSENLLFASFFNAIRVWCRNCRTWVCEILEQEREHVLVVKVGKRKQECLQVDLR
jgi:hypothetical protein